MGFAMSRAPSERPGHLRVWFGVFLRSDGVHRPLASTPEVAGGIGDRV